MMRHILKAVPIFLFITIFMVLGPSRSYADTAFNTIGLGAGTGPTYMVATSTMLYVSNPGNDTVTAIDTSTSATTSIAVGNTPGVLGALGKYIFVGPSDANTVVIDTSNGNSTELIGTGGSSVASMVAIGQNMYLSKPGTDNIESIDTSGSSIVSSSFSTGAGSAPHGLAASSTELYIAQSGSHSVGMANVAVSNTVTSVDLGPAATTPWDVLPLGSKLYISDEGTDQVSVVDLANGNATSTITVGANPTVMVAIGSKIYVVNSGATYLSTIDTANGNATSTVGIDYFAQDLIAVGTKLYISSPDLTDVDTVDSANGNALGAIHLHTGNEHFATINSNLFVTGDDDAVHEIDTNTTAATLTEVTPVPSTPTSDSVTYSYSASFPTSEQEAVHVGGNCTSGATVQASEVSNGGTSTITISNLTSGTTYSCSLYLVDENSNQSNTLTIGPFTWTQPVVATTGGGSISGGTSVTQQVANLEAMGNTTEAAAIKAQWPQLFGTTTALTPASTASMATGAALASTTSASGSMQFTRNLAYGDSGADVKALQQFLNAHGFTVATSGIGSPGNETDEFGALTRATLAKYQAVNGITPAVGYFGPITRAYIAAHE